MKTKNFSIKVSVDIPEGMDVVDFRVPKDGEFYVGDKEILQQKDNHCNGCVIILRNKEEPSQPLTKSLAKGWVTWCSLYEWRWFPYSTTPIYNKSQGFWFCSTDTNIPNVGEGFNPVMLKSFSEEVLFQKSVDEEDLNIWEV